MAGITVQEFVKQYKKEAPFEIIEGERRPIKLMVAGHATVLKNLYDPLSQFVKEHDLGEVFYRLPYLIVNQDGRVTDARVPDLMFVGKERFEHYKIDRPDWKDTPFLDLPDLAALVAFNDASESRERVQRYIADGVQIAWVVDVRYRTVQIWRPFEGYDPYILRMRENLRGDEIIPGFSIMRVDLFKGILSDAESVRQKVVQQIEEAFADTPYPGDNNIGESHNHVFDGGAAFRGKHWKDVPLETIHYYRSYVSFFTPAAYRFFLPAFMMAVLLHYSEMDVLPGNLLGSLSPKQKTTPVSQIVFARKNADFSRTEQAAILAFLESYLDLHPETYAVGRGVYRPLLDSAIEYWKERLKDNP